MSVWCLTALGDVVPVISEEWARDWAHLHPMTIYFFAELVQL